MSPEDRNIQIEFIHNVYKDTHGVRPRHLDFDSMTDEELDKCADDVQADAQAMQLWEEQAHMEVMTEINLERMMAEEESNRP